MFTLMTGIRDLHDDVGSGLSALMFTLQEQQKKTLGKSFQDKSGENIQIERKHFYFGAIVAWCCRAHFHVIT